MQQEKRNLFPFVAVLTAASALIGICGIVFWAVDQMGQSRVGSSSISQSLNGSSINGSAQAVAEIESSGAPSQTLGAHKAIVLSVESFDVASLERGLNTAAGSAENRSENRSDDLADNLLIASGSYDNTVKIWRKGDRANNLEVGTLAHNGRVNDLVFIPGDFESLEPRLATGSGGGEIKLWNLSTGNLISTVGDRSGRILSLALNADGTYLASGGSNGALKIWPVEAISKQKSQTNLRGTTLIESGSQVNALAFYPTDPNLLLIGDQAGTLKVWDIQNKAPVLTLPSDADHIISLAISPDGQYAASGSDDKLIRIWNLKSGQLMRTLSGHDLAVSGVAFSPNGQVLASSSYDESLKTWDWANAKELCTLKGHDGFVYAVSFLAGGSALISGGYDGTVRTWDLTKPVNQTCLI